MRNGWNRLLVALSAAWLLLIGMVIFAHYPRITSQIAASPPGNPFFDVVVTGNENSPFHIVPHPVAMAGYALLPVALLWAAAAVVRWIGRGFRQGKA